MTNEYQEYYKRLPAYEDGGKKLPSNIKLPPQFVAGTPEYYKRQEQISGRAEAIQPEAYLTPAGYVKDAVNFVEDLSNGNYGGAAVDALLNVIPWGVGKTLKGLKKKLSKVNGATQEFNSYAEPFTTTKTKKGKSKVKTEADYDADFSEVQRKARNISKYEKEISRTIEDAVFPDDETLALINRIDEGYGTNYKEAYKQIAMRDMTNRGKYIKFKELENNAQGRTSGSDIVPDVADISNYKIYLDPSQYVPGTANHELGHLADQLAKNPADNRYLDYLLDESNIMSPLDLRRKGININSAQQAYLIDPQEAKSHLLHLKRGMIQNGDISNWSSKVDSKTVENFLFDPRNTPVVNNMNKVQYNMYRDKNRFIDRLNNLTPMEILMPIGTAGFAGYQSSKE